MPAAAVAVVGTVAGALIQSEGATSAARSAARSSARAQRTITEQTNEAKNAILDRMVPALADYNTAIQQAQDQIAAGSFNVIQTLQQYAGNADQIISNAGIDSQRALMGSAAQASGMPMAQFTSTYNAAQNSPSTVARDQMLSSLPNAGGTGAPINMVRNADGSFSAAPRTLSDRALAAGGAVATGAGTFAPINPETLAGNIGSTGTGFTGAVQDIQSGYGTAQNALDVATAVARGDVTGATGSALAQLAETRQAGLGEYTPYTEAGRAAIAKEAALSGAMGAEAQQAAINEYIESPGQAYLRKQQEEALLRNSAAIGGLGGGNVRTALQQQAMDIASTQQQQYLENLRSIATRGQEAAGATTGLISSTGLYGAQLTAGAGNTLAQLEQQYGISSANLAQMSSTELANLAQATGINIANLNQAVASARAGLQTELGSSIANTQANTASSLANLATQAGTTTLSGQQNIAQLLANLATQSGSNVANLQLGTGQDLAAGQYLSGQALASGLSGLGNLALYQQYLNSANSGSSNSSVPYSTLGIGNPSNYTNYITTPTNPAYTNAGIAKPYT